MTSRLLMGASGLVLTVSAGCGTLFAPRPAPLFVAPLTVDGTSVDPAIIDTGGGYELMLRDAYDLNVVGFAEVVAFGGRERVSVTEGFPYSVGGWDATADSALVGVSICDCNGVGFHFFRKTGAVLDIDFQRGTAELVSQLPPDGVRLAFREPPENLPSFDSAFIDVVLEAGDETRDVRALLDTGANTSVIRSGLIAKSSASRSGRVFVLITHERLGTVAASLNVFETDGLPDLIIGTDIMRVWSDRWYFRFALRGGSVTVFPQVLGGIDSAASPTAVERVLRGRLRIRGYPALRLPQHETASPR